MLNEKHGASSVMLSRFGKLSPYDAEDQLLALIALERSEDLKAMEEALDALETPVEIGGLPFTTYKQKKAASALRSRL